MPTPPLKTQRTSPPPPPSSAQSDRPSIDPQKVRKHKESYHQHHHSQNNSSSSKTHTDMASINQRPVKHPLPKDSLSYPKNKKMKQEEITSLAHKQPLSLNDYRQSKRYIQDPNKSIKQEQRHHSVTTNHLSRDVNKHHLPPPLPPPLPLKESPPPPPPPT